MKNVRAAGHCADWIRGGMVEEVVRRDGRGSGQVWPEVNMFLETVSQILLTGAVSSVTVSSGDSKRKGALDAVTAQPGWRASRNSFPSYSPSLSRSLSTIYFAKLRGKKKKEKKNALCL